MGISRGYIKRIWNHTWDILGMIMGIRNMGIDWKYVNNTLFAGMVNFRQKSIKPYREYDGDTMGTSRGKNGYRHGKNINGIMLEQVENPLSCGRVCGCVTNACSSLSFRSPPGRIFALADLTCPPSHPPALHPSSLSSLSSLSSSSSSSSSFFGFVPNLILVFRCSG